MIKFRLDRNLLIIDVETTGTTGDSSIIQLGAIKFSKHGKIMNTAPFEMNIIPYTDKWDIEAERVHNISKDWLLKNGNRIETVLRCFEEWVNDDFKNYYIAQWSCGFDSTMLQLAYTQIDRKYPFSYRCYDIASIVRFYLALGNELSFSKKGQGQFKCAIALGIKVEKESLHNALFDATLAGKMLEKIIWK